MAARSISGSAWPAATRTFFGVQPRFGQVPPRSCDSIIAIDIPARLTGPVTPMPALPPPRITTSNFSDLIEFTSSIGDYGRARKGRVHCRGLKGFSARRSALLLGRDCRRDRLDDHGRHLELRDAVPDVVTPGDPLEIGPDRPYPAVVVLRKQQADRPVEPGVRVRRDELGPKRRISEYQVGSKGKV